MANKKDNIENNKTKKVENKKTKNVKDNKTKQAEEKKIEKTVKSTEEKKIEKLVKSTKEEKIENKKSTTNVQPIKDNKLFIISGVLALVLVALYFGYNRIYNSSKMIFLRSINKEYKELENLFSDYTDNKIYKLADEDNFLTEEELNFKIKTDDSIVDNDTKGIIDEVNDLKINVKSGVDRKNKQMLANLALLSEEDNLINVSMYLTKEKLYYELKDLLDKYIEIPIENYDDMFNSNTEKLDDTKYITRTLKDTILENLEEKDFKTSKQKVTIDSKKINTKKIYYVLNEKRFINLSKKVIIDLKENKKFISKISSITKKESEIKEGLTKSINNIDSQLKKNEFSEKAKITFAVYTKGFSNETIKYEMIVDNNEEEVGISYIKSGKIKEVNLISDGINILKVKTTKKDNKNSQTVVTLVSAAKMTIDTKHEDNKVKNSFVISFIGSNDFGIKGNLISEMKEKTKNKKYTQTVKFDISMESSNIELINFQMNLKSNIKKVNKLDIPKISNSIKYSELTDEDLNTIINNLSKNEKLIKLIEKIIGNSSSSYMY